MRYMTFEVHFIGGSVATVRAQECTYDCAPNGSFSRITFKGLHAESDLAYDITKVVALVRVK